MNRRFFFVAVAALVAFPKAIFHQPDGTADVWGTDDWYYTMSNISKMPREPDWMSGRTCLLCYDQDMAVTQAREHLDFMRTVLLAKKG